MTPNRRGTFPKLIVDAASILADRPSGIGHYALGIIKAFDDFASRGVLSYSLLAPKRLLPRADALGLDHRDPSVAMHPLKKNLAHQILKRSLPLAMDRVMPSGVYYFPAFKMLPMHKRASAVVIHDMAHLDMRGCVEQGNVAQLDYSLPHVMMHASAIVTVSRFSRDRIAHHFGIDPTRITVATPAVDRQCYRPMSADDSRRIRESCGVFTDDFVLSVGNLEPRKNHANVIRAFAALPPEKTRNLSLVIIGADGWQSDDIEAAIARAAAKGIRILRPTRFVADEEMAAFYSAARFLAFLPLYEGFGMPPLEAYACGTPVLASRVASVPEAAGECAIYVDDPLCQTEIRARMLDMLNVTEQKPASLSAEMATHLSRFCWHRSALVTAQALTGVAIEA
ncbi:glycosyltransferase family 1 protein [Robbsia sp. KACC 23696]|uniref:glycosyltransferase family 4 protein n=1 Tax=Robbsia sp. KACC 23696 TaxID=3149231 RepID=UPI00325B5BC6